MKTKNEVLGMTLTQEQRIAAERLFEAYERFGRPAQINATTAQEVKDFLNKAAASYHKRKEADAKRKEKKELERNFYKDIISIIKDAKNYGFTDDDILSDLKSIIKDKKNAQIQAKIAELQAQLID